MHLDCLFFRLHLELQVGQVDQSGPTAHESLVRLHCLEAPDSPWGQQDLGAHAGLGDHAHQLDQSHHADLLDLLGQFFLEDPNRPAVL